MVTAALSSMVGSAVSQVASGQGLDFGKLAMAGAIGAATAGLTNGITFDGTSFGVNSFDTVLKGTNSLANLAGTNNLGGILQAAQDGATGTLAQQAVGVLGTSLVGAGINTAVYGGSFGNALEGSLVAQGAALGANEIGATTEAGSLQNVAEHAALGCIVGAASGGDCASGAIGAATSAAISPLLGKALGIDTNADRASSINQAILIGTAMLAGGSVATAFGQNANTAAQTAQNEAANNYLSAKQEDGLVKALKGCAQGDTACVEKWTSYYAGVNNDMQQAARNCGTPESCKAISNDARTAPTINTDANLATCQGVSSCIALLNNVPSQNVTADVIATNRSGLLENARNQEILRRALANDGASPATQQVLSGATPQDIAGSALHVIGAVVSAVGNRQTANGPDPAVGTSGRGPAYDDPSSLVQSRVDELTAQIPENSKGRITMGVAVVEDANGARSVLVSTSEPRGYLRPGVTLQSGEQVVAGTGHAEADIVAYAQANGLRIVDIGATRPVCASCQSAIAPTGANVSTPLKPLPKSKQ